MSSSSQNAPYDRNGEIVLVSWSMPISFVLLVSALQVTATYNILKKKVRKSKLRMINKVFFFLNIAITNGVAIRGQFPTSPTVLKANSWLTTISTFLSIFVGLIDHFFEVKPKISSFRSRSLGLKHLRKKFFFFNKNLSGPQWIDLISTLLQFIFYGSELLVRYLSEPDENDFLRSAFITREFSVVPLILSSSSVAAKHLKAKEISKTINLLLLDRQFDSQVGSVIEPQ